MFLHQTRMMTVKNSVFVDNWLGMHIKVNMGFEVTGCTFIGRLASCRCAQGVGVQCHV